MARLSRYKDLNNNYTHQTVNHSQNFVNPDTGAHTQTVERGWNRAKVRNRARWGYTQVNA